MSPLTVCPAGVTPVTLPPLTELCPGTPDTVLSPDPPGNRRRAARDARPAAKTATGGGGAGEFFAALGDAWRLTDTQRARLTPAVNAALGMGWTPQALASATGANTTGVQTQTRCWPRGYHRLNCPYRHHRRRGRRGAASVIRSHGCWTTTATPPAHAQSAKHRGPGKPMLSESARVTTFRNCPASRQKVEPVVLHTIMAQVGPPSVTCGNGRGFDRRLHPIPCMSHAPYPGLLSAWPQYSQVLAHGFQQRWDGAPCVAVC